MAKHRFRINIACLLLAMPLAQGCTTAIDRATVVQGSAPRLLIASPESRVGGEARFEGELQIRNNCVVVAGSRDWKGLPIFDPSVRLTETGDAILDSRTGVRVGVGERFSASAAHFRDEGQGWSLSDIEQATGVTVPGGCGAGTVIRLGDIQKGASL